MWMLSASSRCRWVRVLGDNRGPWAPSGAGRASTRASIDGPSARERQIRPTPDDGLELARRPFVSKASGPQEFLGRGQGRWTRGSLLATGRAHATRPFEGRAYLIFEPEHRP